MKLWNRILIALALVGGLYAGYHVVVLQSASESLPLHWLGHKVELVSPRWLGLLCLLPLIWLFSSGTLVDMSRSQHAVSLMVRALLLITLALALARPSVESSRQRVCTVFVVDVSASISEFQLRHAHGVVDRAYKARGENEVRLVTFAASPRAIKIPADAIAVPQIARHRGKQAGESSDIEAAIQHAYGLFPADMLKRMVLLSDGNETSGSLVAESYRAVRRKVKIHAHRLPERKEKEVLVRALRLPAEVRVGAPFDVSAEVFSTHDEEQVTLTLYKDEFINGLDGRKKIALRKGRNVIKFKSMVREAGTVGYRLVMRGMQRDTWSNNNRASAILPVHGRPRVLYVEGEPAYAGYLKRALEAERIDVVVRGPHGVPRSAVQLAKFDLLILSDTPAMYVGPGQMSAIASYVRDLGGGFIMAGGPNSFGAGGYYNTRIEKILPVRFDTEKKRDQPSLALVLCIDRSGSMEGIKMELAKDAAKATTEILGGSDLIGVVAFDSSAHLVVRLQRAANRLRIISDISRLRASGGTAIKPALAEAFNQLQGARAKVKHVILLSDGQSPYAGINQLVTEMARARITVSSVGVGSGADRNLLQTIAERGGGRFYHTDDARNIPKIFTKETTQVARSALVEEAIRVQILKRANVIQGINWGSAPALRGYVSTKPKPRSETLLVSNYGEPILSLWRVGLGKTAAFTSDVKNRWAVGWLNWPGYRQFWAQLVREIMRHRIQRSYEMKARARQGTVQVTVDALNRADRFINGLDAQLTVFNPFRPGRKLVLPLHQTAAGRYEANFRLPSYGSFLLRGRYRNAGKLVAESITSLAVPYPEEYTQFIQRPAHIARAAAITGGQSNPSVAAIFDPGGEKVVYHRDLWSWLIFGVLGLLALDVLLRRVRFLGYRTD